MGKFISQKRGIPRKDHTCQVCGSLVQAGRECVIYRGVEEDIGHYTIYMHLECRHVSRDWREEDWETAPNLDRIEVLDAVFPDRFKIWGKSGTGESKEKVFYRLDRNSYDGNMVCFDIEGTFKQAENVCGHPLDHRRRYMICRLGRGVLNCLGDQWMVYELDAKSGCFALVERPPLHPYRAYDRAAEEGWSILVFAFNSKSALRLARKHELFNQRYTEFTDVAVQRMKETPYLMGLRISNQAQHVIDNPPCCPRCETWGYEPVTDERGKGCQWCIGAE